MDLAVLATLSLRASFNSGKVDTAAINDLNYRVYTFHYESTHDQFKGSQGREQEACLYRKSISIFQQRDPANMEW